ncbi:hypothetical protein [Candidatus Pantoea multigeneris]|uniref:hypothetical protein n=1 Tax=Candidatus Pantoea multigeneris TaxID=2608357 RepID=UPI00141EB0B7|nr:hypothetical protein [Pantoea multigeneris]
MAQKDQWDNGQGILRAKRGEGYPALGCSGHGIEQQKALLIEGFQGIHHRMTISGQVKQ